MRAPLRLIAFLFLVVGFFTTSFLVWLFSSKSGFRDRVLLITQDYASWTLKMMNVKINVSGAIGIQPGSLIVCNHMSYLDVLIVASSMYTPKPRFNNKTDDASRDINSRKTKTRHNIQKQTK